MSTHGESFFAGNKRQLIVIGLHNEMLRCTIARALLMGRLTAT